ncbi:hypothetical protein MQX03_18565 [Chryseobacterium aahli]|uniref:hypothetical protein n=1 Tax=Chryseobacterium aahli TaxID=1278643 RepID=UPI001F614D5A|nr:hypothetical protein [Chryseobacterium aahli]MCI3939181.1 hypothetical protein [Chryseobacterium aahli]
MKDIILIIITSILLLGCKPVEGNGSDMEFLFNFIDNQYYFDIKLKKRCIIIYRFLFLPTKKSKIAIPAYMFLHLMVQMWSCYFSFKHYE